MCVVPLSQGRLLDAEDVGVWGTVVCDAGSVVRGLPSDAGDLRDGERGFGKDDLFLLEQGMPGNFDTHSKYRIMHWPAKPNISRRASANMHNR
eukprot:82226-Pyramimonas_sp.AAC.1